MAPRALPLPLLLVLVLAVGLFAAAHASAAGGDFGERRRWLQEDNSSSTAGAASLLMGYISYSALFADSVPCSRQGASYYNCQPGAEANPYQRGCSAITQCRD
ncbi:rapid alkalinization factor 23 [Brachypodium distachyon]|uniref:Uncharacterized protein n=1 Tax=Brachypodium distachyon TaxID=15368 RepID=I1GRA0_BRADI|nr:rapid alkalinization factor 23 [Brachypodium distachyon]KQK14706.1 hypothetical protein BRADI_1g18185v3 [Brachypodium distachyon]|eukprot:XP_003559814.1 rapid alkalinization factor 23 [Brachypodium distachyon]